MNPIRFTNLHNNGSSNYGAAFIVGMGTEDDNPTNPTAQLGVDEIVLNSNSGTLASLQEPVSFIDAMKNGNRCYSFRV